MARYYVVEYRNTYSPHNRICHGRKDDIVNAPLLAHATNIAQWAEDLGGTVTMSQSCTVTEANSHAGSIGFSTAYGPFYKAWIDVVETTDQELKVMFYPDNNVEEITTDQELKVMFYPNGNVQDIATDQELKVMFYPVGNVEDEITLDQELKVMFYPNGNVQDVQVSNDFKWWFGMKGKKKYGNSKVKRIRL